MHLRWKYIGRCAISARFVCASVELAHRLVAKAVESCHEENEHIAALCMIAFRSIDLARWQRAVTGA